MTLGIDFRFYRPEPYGLANYIAGTWPELIKLLDQDKHISKVILFMDKSNQGKNLNTTLKGFSALSEKFEIVHSAAGYYNLKEQTEFLKLVNSFNLDLMYFFTGNYPLLYTRPFIYQVFDFTHQHQAKKKKSLSYKLKSRIFLEIIRRGINKSKHVLFLGNQTKAEASIFTSNNFTDPESNKFKPNTVLQAGVSRDYLQLPQTNPERFGLTTELKKANNSEVEEAEKWRQSVGIKGDYGVFVSVWKSHKNLTKMIQSFTQFNNLNPDFQLVICGKKDPLNREEIDILQNHQLSKKGTILWLESLPDVGICQLQDKASFFIQPSLSEGFGLTLIEAASRGCPLICSNIDIFKSIMNDDSVVFFDPNKQAHILQAMITITNKQNSKMILNYQRKAYHKSLGFRWEKVSTNIYNAIKQVTENS
jgi:glycosyltransferase involved in cell wall biosynthesis